MSLGPTITLQQLDDNPYPLFQQMLAHEPVCWLPELNMWLILRYEDVVQALLYWQTFGLESEPSLIADTLGPMMLSMDGAAHQRLRVPFAMPFRPKPLRRTYAQMIADITNLLVDEFVAVGTADLHTQFSNERGQQAFARFHSYVIGVLEQLQRQPDESVLGR